MLSDAGCLLAVADGMGGMNAGEEASKIAIETVKEMFGAEKLPEDETSIEKYMKSVFVEADRRIKEKAIEDKNFELMGTTLVLAWIKGDKARIAWCGDSRAYSFHSVYGLRQLSKDHSHVQELVDTGVISPENAFNHPLSNIITQSLGDPCKMAKADYVEYALHHNETILLCSDGLNGELRNHEIEKIIRDNDSLLACSETLINEALNAGGRDNVTLAICKITGGLPDLAPQETPIEKKALETHLSQTVKDDESKKRKWWQPLRFLNKSVVGLFCILTLFSS